MLQIGLPHFLVVAAALFAFGAFCVVTRKNAVGILMGVELILNAANINFVAFNHYSAQGLHGQIFALFVIVLAAAEAAVGLAIVLALYQSLRSIDVTRAEQLKE
ncbi:MAG: NADH-quinone oxidoreductase subunit NuoK [Deltaproteobacteria bacterium]